VRFQVQEMARVEKIATDEGIQAELDVYNRLLPAPGVLSATLFIELVSEEDLRHWLPRLISVERALRFEIGGSAGVGARAGGITVESVPETQHAESLTRAEVTPAVHYLRFPVPPEAVRRFAGGDLVSLAVRHPQYEAETQLGPDTQRMLLADLEGRTEPLALG
ncbi:MAG: DUF3501 family protein, partial [Candidatus Dormibacteria bacterium]